MKPHEEKEIMDFTWKEYQKALNIVKTFEKQREQIKSKKRNFNWLRTYNDIVWEKRYSLNKLQYDIRKITAEKRKEIGEDFIKKLISDEKDKLLEIRKKAMLSAKQSINNL